jgi:hypothetical protein
MRTKSIKAIMATVHVPYGHGLAECNAAETQHSMEIYDPEIFATAVKALFEQRTIAFTD